MIQKSRVAGRLFTGSIHAAMWFPFGGHASEASEKGPLEVHGARGPPHLKLQYACPYFQLPGAPTAGHIPCKDIVAPTVLQHRHAVSPSQKVAFVVPHGFVQTPSHTGVFLFCAVAPPGLFQTTRAQALQELLKCAD